MVVDVVLPVPVSPIIMGVFLALLVVYTVYRLAKFAISLPTGTS